MRQDIVQRTTTTRIPTGEGTFQLSHYIDTRDGKEHLALVMGDVENQQGVLIRVHSECFTGDVLGSLRCDCGEQLHEAMRRIAAVGKGVILYLRQEGRGIGLEQKLKAYNLQDQGYDTVDANLMLGHHADEREYAAAAGMLHDLGIQSVRLMTNNPAKIDALRELGIVVDERLPLNSTVTKDNAAYLATKIQRMRHLLSLPLYTNGNHAPVANTATSATVTPDLGIEIQLALLERHLHEQVEASERSFVTISYAQTLNGTIGLANGGQLQISGPESLVVTHRLRAMHDAILVGIGTVLADDPRLTARLGAGDDPQPIIVDTHLRTPPDARLWSHPKSPWFATLDPPPDRAAEYRKRGATVLTLPGDGDGGIQIETLFAKLAQLQIRSIMVEGGASIISTLLQRQLADYAVVTVAPRLIHGISVTKPAFDASSHFVEPKYLQAGDDMTIWGELKHIHNVDVLAMPKIAAQPKVAADSPLTSAL